MISLVTIAIANIIIRKMFQFRFCSQSLSLFTFFPAEVKNAIIYIMKVILNTILFYRMAYGFRAHILNLAVYSLGLIPLTLLITNLEPHISFNATLQYGPFDNKVQL